MADVWKFVDSPDAGATVRLDINDDSHLNVRHVTWNPPRLRRALSQNLMTDGGYVGPSSFDMRLLVLDMDIVNTSQNTWAATWQPLMRELNRETNWLMYKPDGATNPVFFKTYRSDTASVEDMLSAIAFRQPVLEILTDPHAYGELTSISVGAVANTAPSFLVQDFVVKGDVAAPFVMVDATPSPGTTTAASYRYNWQLAVTTRNGADQPVVVQCEALTLGTDMAVSGSVARQTPTSTNSAVRMTYTPTGATAEALRGTYRLYAVATLSSTTAGLTMTASAAYGSSSANFSTGASISEAFSPTGSERHLFDFGTVDFTAASALVPTPRVEISSAMSVSGVGTIRADWDYLIFVPIDEARLIGQFSSGTGGPSLPSALVFDGIEEHLYGATSASVFSTAALAYDGFTDTGGYPVLTPGVDNLFVYFRYSTLTGAPPSSEYVDAASGALTLYYYPRYTTVRTVST